VPEETEELTTCEMDEKYINAARTIHGCDGECEIDEGATVSYSSDGGAYVAAWVWVPCRAVGLTKEQNDEYV
jgi:hypothetical protein